MCEQELETTLYFLLSSYSCVKNITPESPLLQHVMMDRRDIQNFLVDIEIAFSTAPIDPRALGTPQTAGQLIDSILELLTARSEDLRFRAKALLEDIAVKPTIHTEGEV